MPAETDNAFDDLLAADRKAERRIMFGELALLAILGAIVAAVILL